MGGDVMPYPSPLTAKTTLVFYSCTRSPSSHLRLILRVTLDEFTELRNDLGIAVGVAAVRDAVGLGTYQRENLTLDRPCPVNPANLNAATPGLD